MRIGVLLYLPVALAIAACSSNEPADRAAPPAANTPAGMAINLLSIQLGAEPDKIEIISEEARDFGDTSLGCPQPGLAYAQVITAGHIITAEYADKTYDVRVAGSRSLICNPSAETGAER